MARRDRGKGRAKDTKAGEAPAEADPTTTPTVYEQLSTAIRTVTLPNGQRVVEVNTERLEQPEKAVAATSVTAVLEEGQLFLVFGQAPPGSTHFHQALIVVMPVREVLKAIHESNPTFVEGCLTAVRVGGYEPAARAYDPEHLPTGRVVYERAAIMAIAYTDSEADVRFWRVVPSQMRTVSPQRIADAIAPVVTVFLPTSKLADLLLQIQAVVEGSES